MAEKSLEVKNLRISFRTNNGKVQAVRDISFDMERGRTLAIVGESGSGKSVTSRAIMGILAGNGIVESGEILYDGKDLLKISEDEMYKIRGDKIAMIFQDPLSSLNPIVKIGKQITEAMLLKSKASRKESRKEFNSMLELIRKNMAAAIGDEAKATKMVETFDKFCTEGNHMENRYNDSVTAAETARESVEDFLFRASKNVKLDVKVALNGYADQLKKINDPFFSHNYKDRLSASAEELKRVVGDYRKNSTELPQSILTALNNLQALMNEMCAQLRPDFFRIGFYTMQNPNEDVTGRDVAELNESCLSYLDNNFMHEFLELLGKAVVYANKDSLAKKEALLGKLNEAENYFAGDLEERAAVKYANELSTAVENSIDRMEIKKDSAAYTFRARILNAVNKYFEAVKLNPKEEARFEKQTKKRDRLVARGKNVDWKVTPKVIYDLDERRGDILKVIKGLEESYRELVSGKNAMDASQRSVEIIDYMKDKASKVAYKVTPAIAKERAIKLMEEVGISEPRMRFYQYPFEFSGGMRQRIVIAIALSADPEILICDEPTTALDVTIQAQILELINRLKAERNLSVIFITHDLGVVANMADDIAVMYAGKIVEYGTADDIFYDPRHPYTWALLSSMPDLDTQEKLDAIPGTPPNMIYPPVGDAFADRNKYAMEIDFELQPPMFQVSETHRAATWLLHPDAPKVELPKMITDRIARMKKAGGAQ